MNESNDALIRAYTPYYQSSVTIVPEHARAHMIYGDISPEEPRDFKSTGTMFDSVIFTRWYWRLWKYIIKTFGIKKN